MPYTIPRGRMRDGQFYQSFNGLVGEYFKSIAKCAVCWQFCWQLPPGLSQPPDAQASKMEPVVGLEPTTDGLQNRCSTTELNWRSHSNHQLELKISTGVGEVPFAICVPVFGRLSGLEKGQSTYQPNANLELIWTGPGHFNPISYATDQAQLILGGTNSMASQFAAALNSEFEVNALEIVRFRKCGRMIRRVTCCLQFRELSCRFLRRLAHRSKELFGRDVRRTGRRRQDAAGFEALDAGARQFAASLNRAGTL